VQPSILYSRRIKAFSIYTCTYIDKVNIAQDISSISNREFGSRIPENPTTRNTRRILRFAFGKGSSSAETTGLRGMIGGSSLLGCSRRVMQAPRQALPSKNRP
jgi:hypothetical protein